MQKNNKQKKISRRIFPRRPPPYPPPPSLSHWLDRRDRGSIIVLEKKNFFFILRDIATKFGGLLENVSRQVVLGNGVRQTPHVAGVDDGRTHEKGLLARPEGERGASGS